MTSIEYEWFTDFSMSLRKEKTRINYKKTIDEFLNLVQKNFIHIDRYDAEAYITYLKQKKMTARSIYNHISILSSFSNYIIENQLADNDFINYFYTIIRPSIENYVSKDHIPTTLELNKLLEAAADNPTYYLIISLVVRCGLTEEEIFNLNIGDFIIDKAGHKAIRINKQTRIRYVKIPEDIAVILDKYFSNKDTSDKEKPLFMSRKGNRLAIRTIQYNINKITEKAKIGKKVTLQDLRSYAAAVMLKSGASAIDVANTLGSVNVGWMQRYDRILPDLDNTPIDLSYLTIKSY